MSEVHINHSGYAYLCGRIEDEILMLDPGMFITKDIDTSSDEIGPNSGLFIHGMIYEAQEGVPGLFILNARLEINDGEGSLVKNDFSIDELRTYVYDLSNSC